MMVKADFILPNHILMMDYLSEQKPEGKCKCGGKQECQQCIFKIEQQELNKEELKDDDMFSDDEGSYQNLDKIDVDVGPMLKLVERRVYEQNRYIFPYYNWKTVELTGLRT